MKNGVIIILIILFFLSTLFIVFPPNDFYSEIMDGNVSKKLITALIILCLSLPVIIRFLEVKYPKEYQEAEKISHTPKNKYGWYGLIFFFSFFAIFYLCLYLLKYLQL